MKFTLLILTLIASQLCDSYKILVMFPAPSRSHNILGTGVVKHLLDAGHEVTHVTPYPRKDPPPRLHQIDISDIVDEELLGSLTNISAVLNGEDSTSFSLMFKFISLFSVGAIENHNFAKLLGDTTQKFDAVIAEWTFSDLFTGLSTVFECPFIWLCSIDSNWMILDVVDELPNPAYVPDAFSSNSPPFTFIGRAQELFYMMTGLTLKTLFTSYDKNQYNRLFEPYLKQRRRTLPPFDDVRFNASLILGNSHVSYGFAHKLPQNYKPIGGYHIDREVKPLADDFKKLLDNAVNGVIYFSMGSIIKSKDLPDILKRDLLTIFSKLKQTVIWKFEEVLPDLPKNVHIVKWAPQQSILAHPNCIMFITHGGMLSTTETIHFGKPIIGIPVFADQTTNINKAVKRGYAIRVDLSYNMIDKLEKAIVEMQTNPKYAETAKRISVIYHDRPVPPGTELIHWVEHVVRTRGAPHLRSPALGMPFYQKMYLDLIVLIIIIIFVLKITIKRLCCPTKKVNKEKKYN